MLDTNGRPYASAERDDFSTLEVAQQLGMAVRSIQLMVDRGELSAWKTPGGHRRISRASVDAWRQRSSETIAPAVSDAITRPKLSPRRILLIEDSVHYQNLVSMLIARQFSSLALHLAPDGIVGLAMYGQLQPDLLIVDLVLPGIDGATLITSLRSHPQFARSKLVVITSLDEGQRETYSFALDGVSVVHKSRLVLDLPGLLASMLNNA